MHLRAPSHTMCSAPRRMANAINRSLHAQASNGCATRPWVLIATSPEACYSSTWKPVSSASLQISMKLWLPLRQLSLLLAVVTVACSGHQSAPAQRAAAEQAVAPGGHRHDPRERPVESAAILIGSPRGEEYIDRNFVRALQADGFVVDWTD